jgi:hypothetical protein
MSESEKRVRQIVAILSKKFHEEHPNDDERTKIVEAGGLAVFCNKHYNPTWGQHDFNAAVKQLIEDESLYGAVEHP